MRGKLTAFLGVSSATLGALFWLNPGSTGPQLPVGQHVRRQPLVHESYDLDAEGPFDVASDEIWAFTRRGSDDRLTLVRVDVGSGDITRAGAVGEIFPGSILVKKNVVWTVSNRWDDSGGPWRGSIQRWDRDSLNLLDTYSFRGTRPTEIVALRHSLWVTVPGGEGLDEIWRLEPDTGDVLEKVEVGAESTHMIAAAGKLWVSDIYDGGVWVIDPSNGHVVATPGVDRWGSSYAMDFDGRAVWVLSRGSVFRVDAASLRTADHVRVRGNTSDVASAFGRIWITESRRNELTAIDPASGSRTGEHIKIPNSGSQLSELVASGDDLYVGSYQGTITRVSR
jgi:hypothetical protein